MSEYSAPFYQRGANLIEAHFTSLDEDATQAVLDALVNNAFRLEWAIDASPQVLVPARAGFAFVLTDLVILATEDLSAVLSGENFTVNSTAFAMEVFQWDDYLASLDADGKVAHIVQDGISGLRGVTGAPIIIFSSNVASPLVVPIVAIGVWFEI
jgi:hypothetical protein